MSRRWLPLVLLSALVPATLAADRPPLPPRLATAHESVAPGGQTELAIVLDVPRGWHIYHPLVLDTGLPTEVTLTLPDGVTAGPIRYPRPTYGEIEGIAYLGYAGETALLVELRFAETVAPGQTLTIPIQVDGLVCEDNGTCIPFTEKATLNLPVTATAGPAANAELLTRARRALTPPLAEAPHATGSRQFVTHTHVPVGGQTELVTVIQLGPGLHIQARDPGHADLIATRLFIEEVSGIEFDRPAEQWPQPKTVNFPGFGRVRQHEGTVTIRTPLRITDRNFEPREVTLRTLLEYQACNERGQCFPPEMVEGALTFTVVPADQPARAASDTAPPTPAVQTATGSTPSGSAPLTLPVVFLMAFVGGMILNVTPCVLPVLSLKIFGFIQHAGQSRARVLASGLIYAAGIMTSFVILAVVMAVFIPDASWGGVIMQSPIALLLLNALVVALGLSMLGVFEIQLPGAAMDAAQNASSREGAGGAFMSGVLATVLATPCTAPMLGAALGALVSLPKPVMIAGILTVGAGLAFPYVLLTAFPNWLRFVPKPGMWMVKLKQIMGLILLAVPLWLLWVLNAFSDTLVHGAVILLFAIGLAAWLYGNVHPSTSAGTAWLLRVSTVAVLLVGWWLGPVYFGGLHEPPPPDEHTTAGNPNPEPAAAATADAEQGEIAWQNWSPGIAKLLAEQGYTVYVDYTARWCVNCQVNKKLVLETPPVAQRFRELGVVAIKADFTRRNPTMADEIRGYGRNGVPLNIILPAGRPNEPIILPELLTQALVLDRLEQAGASTATPPVTAAGTP